MFLIGQAVTTYEFMLPDKPVAGAQLYVKPTDDALHASPAAFKEAHVLGHNLIVSGKQIVGAGNTVTVLVAVAVHVPTVPVTWYVDVVTGVTFVQAVCALLLQAYVVAPLAQMAALLPAQIVSDVAVTVGEGIVVIRTPTSVLHPCVSVMVKVSVPAHKCAVFGLVLVCPLGAQL